MKTIELQSLIEYVPEPRRSFLNQPLTLGMFVPCDEEGDVLEEPDESMNHGMSDSSVNASDMYLYSCQCESYKAALDRVIFEGFEVTPLYDIYCQLRNKETGIALSFIEENNPRLQINDAPWIFVKTISDLCGYGLKIKVK